MRTALFLQEMNERTIGVRRVGRRVNMNQFHTCFLFVLFLSRPIIALSLNIFRHYLSSSETSMYTTKRHENLPHTRNFFFSVFGGFIFFLPLLSFICSVFGLARSSAVEEECSIGEWREEKFIHVNLEHMIKMKVENIQSEKNDSLENTEKSKL